MRASSACASSARSCASSDEVSSRTSRSPLFTMAPDSKAISRTEPGISGVTVTPWTAVMDPMAVRVPCHFSSRTVAEETDSGGCTNDLPVSMSFLICRVLMPDSPPRTPSTMRMAIAILVFMGERLECGAQWTGGTACRLAAPSRKNRAICLVACRSSGHSGASNGTMTQVFNGPWIPIASSPANWPCST